MISSLFTSADFYDGVNGDFIFDGQDLKIIRDQAAVLYQLVVDFLRSNIGDYALKPFYGADLTANLGVGLNLNIAKSIANKVKSDIIAAGIVAASAVDVLQVVSGNTLYLRVVLFASDNFTVRLAINNTSGVTINDTGAIANA